MTEASVLAARNLVKRYKQRTVVHDVSIEVCAGEIVGLLGPNGAGKTTSFYMVVGLVPADEGEIVLDGENLTKMPMHARARRGIGYLPQEASIFRSMSVQDNVLAILETRADLDGAARQKELDRLLGELHIDHIRDAQGKRCRAVSAAAPRSPGRWPPTHASFCWTSRSRASTPSRWATSRTSSTTCATAVSAC